MFVCLAPDDTRSRAVWRRQRGCLCEPYSLVLNTLSLVYRFATMRAWCIALEECRVMAPAYGLSAMPQRVDVPSAATRRLTFPTFTRRWNLGYRWFDSWLER